ncbi:MAG: S8 family serine peptidase [Candidatus Rokubacteria bacterium]|nr:S8 family serine peptidase [Candidatus Rokubacteria bacterium]
MSRRGLAGAVALSILLWTGLAGAGGLHPALDAQLRALPPGDTLSVIVEMADQADPAAAAALHPRYARTARLQAVRDALQQLANLRQGAIRAHLLREQSLGKVRRMVSLWIFNGLAVTATEPVIRALAARPDVREVRPDALIPMPAPRPAAAGPAADASEWNIAQIRAPEVWALDPAYNGAGTVVGSFDTGVDLTHPDLAGRYRGDHAISWFDPYGQHGAPFDFDGHGTHTTGTAVGGGAGGTNIGVAPGARWIAAKAWNDLGFGFTSAFHEIFQWFLAPGGDPANAPDVVNSSWGFSSAGCIAEFLPDVRAFRAAGIFPAFAAGNDGPEPGSVRSPGTYAESFAVGATDFLDDIAFFSGQGPSPCDGSVKPDVSAPGDSILSSVPGGYLIFSGTSMATPHVTGAVAVLRSINPALTVDELETVLAQGAVDLGPSGPDNGFGAGRLDLFTSAQIVLGGGSRPVVTVVATDPGAAEAGLAPGVFTVSRTGSTDEILTVSYTVGGTATPGSDYAALSGSVTIPAGSGTATILVTPMDDSLVEPDETVVVKLSPDPAYIVGVPGSATVTIASDEVPPDLVIAAFSTPVSGGAGAALTVSDTTKNQGGGAAGASTTKFYLSTNNVLDGSDVLLGSRGVPGLAAGVSSSATTTVTIPAGTATGNYYLIAQADGDSGVAESQEGNNTSTRFIQIGADLVIAVFSTPVSGGAGAALTVSDTTKNQGGGAAGPSTTRFYLSTNSVLDAGDVLLGSRAIPALAPGASSAGSTPLTIPAGTATGNYYLIAQADGDSGVAETQEGNNTSTRPIQVSGP